VCSTRCFLNFFSEPRVYSARVFPARLSIDTLYRSVSSAVNNASASIIYDIPVDNQTATETRRVGSHGRAGTPLPAESRLPGNVAGHPDTKHPYLMSSLSILPARSWPRRKFPLPSPCAPPYIPGHYRLHFIPYIVDTRGRPRRYSILREREVYRPPEMPFLGMRFSEMSARFGKINYRLPFLL